MRAPRAPVCPGGGREPYSGVQSRWGGTRTELRAARMGRLATGQTKINYGTEIRRGTGLASRARMRVETGAAGVLGRSREREPSGSLHECRMGMPYGMPEAAQEDSPEGQGTSPVLYGERQAHVRTRTHAHARTRARESAALTVPHRVRALRCTHSWAASCAALVCKGRAVLSLMGRGRRLSTARAVRKSRPLRVGLSMVICPDDHVFPGQMGSLTPPL